MVRRTKRITMSNIPITNKKPSRQKNFTKIAFGGVAGGGVLLEKIKEQNEKIYLFFFPNP